VILDPATDLTPFAGQRVTIDHFRAARIGLIHHGAEASREALHEGVWGNCIDDPHGDCRGGSTAFWWPYGTDLEVEGS
jgi:hypothetical protein